MSTWNRAAVQHTLRRAGLGASPESIELALGQGRKATLQEIACRDRVEPILEKGLGGILATEDIEPLAAWWMARILGDGAPFVERVALMWHNHFATSHSKVRDTRLMHAQVQLLRDHGRGDFRELLRRIARDPAMLLWLDGNENRVGSPNENFAREVLELFALGLGPYDEHDVQETARAFTGWGVDRRRFVNRERYHDGGIKQILGSRGPFDGEQALELILASPHCPRWVARRLLTEFIHPNPTEREVSDWSDVLVEQGWSIGSTLERLLASDLFLSERARLSRISSPVELLAGASLALGIPLVPRDCAEAAADMGQALYRPPNVKGWTGGRSWIHPGTWLARHNHLVRLAHRDRTERKPRELLEALLPDGWPTPLEQAVTTACAQGRSTDALALVLTSPEAQLA